MVKGDSHSPPEPEERELALPWARLRAGFARDRTAIPGLFMPVLFLSLPNLLAAFWPVIDSHQVENVWIGMGLVLVPAALGLGLRTALRLWLPFVPLVPAVLMYLLVTQSPPREWAFVVLWEADWAEIQRFLAPALVGLCLAVPAVWYYWRFTGRHLATSQRLSWGSRALVFVCVFMLPLAQLAQSGRNIGGQLAQKRLATIFPVGVVVSGWKAWEIRQTLAARSTLARHSTGGLAPRQGPREIYVLVIGESARYASFQIHGYGRETTPLLARTEGLLSFQDVIAPAPITTMSVPLLLTPARPLEVGAASQPSVINVFREAGFHTCWFSTQRQHGMYDTASSLYARDAHEALFVSGDFAPGSGRYPSAHDGALLQPLKERIAGVSGSLFIVLHTMGSHQHYGDRYPPEFDHFPAPLGSLQISPFRRQYSPEQQVLLKNAYDNSIRYTDWFLAQIVGELAATQGIAALLYVSDHGQNTGAAPVMPFAHGNLSTDVLHVPMLVWLSPEYVAARPRQAAALASHVKSRVSASSTFHTLVDLGGLRCPQWQESWSLASPGFQERPRMLMDLKGTLIDYDVWKKEAVEPGP